MHSNSNLSTTCREPLEPPPLPLFVADRRFGDIFDEWSFAVVPDMGFLNTSKRFRFFCCFCLSSLACGWCFVESPPPPEDCCCCDGSREPLAPCRIDFTAWTSRLSGDSLAPRFSAIQWLDKVTNVHECVWLMAQSPSTYARSKITVHVHRTHRFAVVPFDFSRDSISNTTYRIGHCHRIHIHFCISDRVRCASQTHEMST